MKKSSISFFIVFIILACNFRDDAKVKAAKVESFQSTTFQDSLAFVLCQMYGFDQGIRKREIYSEIDKKLAVKIDSINFLHLMEIIQEYGYPSEKLVGENNINQECVDGAAYSILLHNPHRVIHNKEFLNLLAQEASKGNMHKERLFTVLDKYYWWKSGGEKVLYGSQFGMPCKNQKKETNYARNEIGMKPLADSLFIDCSGV